MKVVRFGHLFLAVTALMWAIISGGFAADLSAEAIAEEQSAWLVSAEAQAEQALDRAILTFDSSLIDGDTLQPWFASQSLGDGWLRVFKLGGRWENLAPESGPDWLARRTAFHLSPGEVGALCLILDRDLLRDANLELQIEFFDGPSGLPAIAVSATAGSLFVDLVSSNESVIASSAEYQNLMEGTGEVVVKALEIPLRLYPETRGVYLRGEGGAEDGLFVLGAALLVKESEALSGDEVTDQPTAHRDDSPLSGIGGARPPWPAVVPMQDREGPAEPVVRGSRRTKSGAGLRAKPVSAKSIPQFVQALMADRYFQVTRDVLSAGGGFRSSPLFILEDTFGQSSAIGFSSDGAFRLQAGYQQAEAEPIVFRSVSVFPGPFQVQQRRFNPGLGEVANFSYVLSTEAREVTVRVIDPGDVVVRTLVAQARQSRGLHAVAWDGRDANGALVPANRRYTFTLSAVNNDGVVANYVPANVNEVRIQVNDNIAVISAVSDQPDPFIPANGDSQISYTTTAPVGISTLNMTVEIFADNLTGPSIRR